MFLAERVKKIKLVLTDNDGVLTDTGVYYSERGEELKRFSIRDGMGVELLRKAGIETGIISGENSGSLIKRIEKLQIKITFLLCKNKCSALDEILREHSLLPEEIAFIGDDVNDLEIMSRIGLAACPNDAMPAVKNIAHFVCKNPGGHGAFRDVADMIINVKNQEC